MPAEKIEKITKVSEALKAPSARLQELSEIDLQAKRDRFSALMAQESKTVHADTNTASSRQAPSPIDEAGKVGGQVDPSTRTAPTEIARQAENAAQRIEILKAQLSDPNLHLAPRDQGKLRRKLHHIDENIQTALDKAGTTEQQAAAASNQPSQEVLKPIERFLGMLTHGQSQLERLSTSVQALGGSKDVNPAAMLAIQIKVARVQHEIELFTSLLNKALESTKTIMNVQV